MSLEKTFPTTVVSVIWLGWLAILLPRMIITPLIPQIEQTYSIPHAQAGLLMTGYLLPYAAAQAMVGPLCDRFGPRRFIIVSMLGSSIASLLIWLTTSFEQMLVLRVLAGTLAGMWFAPSTTLVTLSAKDLDRGKAMGIVFMGGSIGNVLIFLLVGYLAPILADWHTFFLIAPIPGLTAAILILLFVKETPRLKAARLSSGGFDAKAVVAGLRKRQVVILLALNMFLMTANWALRTFVPTYLVQVQGLTTSEASLWMLIFAAANVSADPIAGFLADRLGSRLPGLASLTAMCLASLTLPLTLPGTSLLFVLLLWGLIGGWNFTLFNVLITRLVPTSVRGTFLGIYNSLGFVGASIGPILFGYVADVAGFTSFFNLSLGMYLIAVALAVVLKEG